MDEYGGTVNSTSPNYTSIEDASDLKYVKNGEQQTATNPENSGISGKAFYSHLTPQKGTEIGNGYRGSRLTLDNEKIQRTDKIKVSYDFSLYNIINNDGSANVGSTGNNYDKVTLLKAEVFLMILMIWVIVKSMLILLMPQI